MTTDLSPRRPPAGYHVQLLAFDMSDADAVSSAHLGAWATASSTRALERLRLYVHDALTPMGGTVGRSATVWARDRATARRFHDTLDAGRTYIHIIADGATYYEISARPLVFPTEDSPFHGPDRPEGTPRR